MKKNNIKTKVIATTLSAITVLSAAAFTTTTAFAAETHLSTGTSITNDMKVSLDRDLKYATSISSATILKVLDGATKYGKYFAPALGGLLDAFIEKPEERIEKKLTEISDKIDKIFDKIDASEASIKAELTNDLGVQSFYNTFVKFKSQTETMNKKIKQIYAGNLSNADKVAKIGSLTGKYNEWRANFEDVLVELNNLIKKPSLTKNGNIFELTYNHYTNSVMFAGEALDKSKPVCYCSAGRSLSMISSLYLISGLRESIPKPLHGTSQSILSASGSGEPFAPSRIEVWTILIPSLFAPSFMSLSLWS